MEWIAIAVVLLVAVAQVRRILRRTPPPRTPERARMLVVCTASGDPMALVIARDQDWLMGYTLLALEVQGRAILARESAHD